MSFKIETIEIDAREVTTSEKLVIDGNAVSIISVDDINAEDNEATLVYEDYDTGSDVTVTLTGKIKIEERLCVDISGRTMEYPGDHCENQAAASSDYCAYHDEM